MPSLMGVRKSIIDRRSAGVIATSVRLRNVCDVLRAIASRAVRRRGLVVWILRDKLSLHAQVAAPAPASSPPHRARRRTGRTFQRRFPASFSSPGGGGEGVVEFLFQRGAGGGDLGEELFVFGQEVVHVAGAGVGVVRVLEVEVEVAGLDLCRWRRARPARFPRGT